MTEDAEWLRLGSRGDEAAARSLVELHGPYLLRVARSLVENAADAEDAVQETFAAGFVGKFRGESSVRTWLVKILVNRVAMQRRSSKRWPRLFRASEAEEPATANESTDAFSAVDAKADLAALLAGLSPEHREVVVLRELEALSYDEIAEALKLPRGTVESRLFRAREELRRMVRGRDE